MAQAVFDDDHPLEEYLREADDLTEVVAPGGTAEFVVQEEPMLDAREVDDLSWLPVWIRQLLIVLLNELQPTITTSNHAHNRNHSSSSNNTNNAEFAERFKYTVISSSLLSSTLSTNPQRPLSAHSPAVPGKLFLTPRHSRSSSRDSRANRDSTSSTSTAVAPSPLKESSKHDSHAHREEEVDTDVVLDSKIYLGPYVFSTSTWERELRQFTREYQHYWPYALFFVLYTTEFYLTSLFVLGFALYCTSVRVRNSSTIMTTTTMNTTSNCEADMTPSFDALQDLILANESWDHTIQTALRLLETSSSHLTSPSPISPSKTPKSTSPSSSLRIALQSSLHTTESQCSNIRHLFAALASPSDLPQISEMYAPASPAGFNASSKQAAGSSLFPPSEAVRPMKGLGLSGESHRPLSLPMSRRRTSSNNTAFDENHSRKDKRSTWNGSYFELAQAGSPHRASLLPFSSSTYSSPLLDRERSGKNIKRRSDLSSILQPPPFARPGENGTSVSAPVTPALQEVSEEDDDDDDDDEAGLEVRKEELPQEGSFGVDALDLHRRRRERGVSRFELSSTTTTTTTTYNLGSPSPSPTPSSTLASRRQSSYLPLSPSTPTKPRLPIPQSMGIAMSTSYSTPAFPTSSTTGTRFTALSSSKKGGTRGGNYNYHFHEREAHPLSISSIRSALGRAVASKRYTCSYLLALRFSGGSSSSSSSSSSHHHHHHNDDSGDEGKERGDYWEDVRSVIGLLVGVLDDAASRLAEVIEEEERRRVEEEEDDLELDLALDADGSSRPTSPGDRKNKKILLGDPPKTTKVPLGRALLEMDLSLPSRNAGFAPTLGHLARFAAHVDAIWDALDDAKRDLERCVEGVRREPSASPPSACSPPASASASAATVARTSTSAAVEDKDTATHPAVRAYEDLRREIGLALRECERGRERLVDLVTPPPPPPAAVEQEQEQEDPETESALPWLAPDAETDESIPSSTNDAILIDSTEESPEGPDLDLKLTLDDVTAHLLSQTSASSLPPPGPEKVFESDSHPSVGVFDREKSRLSREERIRIVKESREGRKSVGAGNLLLGADLLSVGGGPEVWEKRKSLLDQCADLLGEKEQQTNNKQGREVWGPGGEVVRELKDVIWEVGKRRRGAPGAEGGEGKGSVSF